MPGLAASVHLAGQFSPRHAAPVMAPLVVTVPATVTPFWFMAALPLPTLTSPLMVTPVLLALKPVPAQASTSTVQVLDSEMDPWA